MYLFMQIFHFSLLPADVSFHLQGQLYKIYTNNIQIYPKINVFKCLVFWYPERMSKCALEASYEGDRWTWDVNIIDHLKCKITHMRFKYS